MLCFIDEMHALHLYTGHQNARIRDAKLQIAPASSRNSAISLRCWASRCSTGNNAVGFALMSFLLCRASKLVRFFLAFGRPGGRDTPTGTTVLATAGTVVRPVAVTVAVPAPSTAPAAISAIAPAPNCRRDVATLGTPSPASATGNSDSRDDESADAYSYEPRSVCGCACTCCCCCCCSC